MKNFYNLRKGIFLLFTLMAFSYSAQAVNLTWDGGGDGVTWSDAANWTTNTAPGANDNAIFTSTVTVNVTATTTVKVLDIRSGITVTLNITGTLNVGAAATSNVVRLDAATLVINSGTLNVTSDLSRDCFQFIGTGGTLNVMAGATVNVSGQEGFTSRSDAIDGTIINSGIINIGSVSGEDAIELHSSDPLTLVNNECAVINLGGANIKTSTSGSVATTLTNDGLITHTGAGSGIRIRNTVSSLVNNGFYDYASSADFATGNGGAGRVDNGVELNPAVSIDAGTNCVIDLTLDPLASGMEAYDWAFGGTTFAANDGGGLLDLTDAGFPNEAGPHTITVAGCPEYSISIQVENTCALSVLPVELVSFTGKERGTANVLEWVTASELNNDFFEIQRSTNGRDFETLENVKGNGTLNTVSTYRFIDEKPATICYYRLQQVDFDGKSELSDIVTVKRDLPKDGAELFPSPVKDVLSINYQATDNKELTVSIIDMTGRVLISKLVDAVKGNNEFNLDLANLPTGTYMTRLNSGTDHISQIIIKL